jgi:hypothetical protein
MVSALVVFLWNFVAKKWSDTVGELKSAAICVSYMPSLKAKKLEKLPQEKVLLELGNRFANSIRADTVGEPLF